MPEFWETHVRIPTKDLSRIDTETKNGGYKSRNAYLSDLISNHLEGDSVVPNSTLQKNLEERTKKMEEALAADNITLYICMLTLGQLFISQETISEDSIRKALQASMDAVRSSNMKISTDQFTKLAMKALKESTVNSADEKSNENIIGSFNFGTTYQQPKPEPAKPKKPTVYIRKYQLAECQSHWNDYPNDTEFTVLGTDRDGKQELYLTKEDYDSGNYVAY